MLESTNLNRHYDDKNWHYKIDTLTSFLAKDSSSKQKSDTRLSDEALMAAYVSGNVAAFERLYGRHKDPILRYFIRQTSNRASAEELAQETWQSLIRNSDSYKSSAKFTTYLYHIAHSRLVDFYRKQGRENWLLSLDDDEQKQQPLSQESEQPDRLVDASKMRSRFLEALNDLPAGQREVFVLKYESGMTVPDIANTLQINPEAVKSRLRYAISKLKEQLAHLSFQID